MIADTRLQKAKEVLQGFKKSEGLNLPNNMEFKNAKLIFGLSEIDTCLDGGLAINALHEVRANYAKDIGAATGFVFSLLHQLFSQSHASSGHISNKHVVWVVDPASKQECGTLYPRGLAQYGIDPEHITFIRARDLHTAMWAVDEAVKCQGLAAVIFQVKGNPKRFDMTASRRLMLRAQASNVFTCVLRQSGEEEASAAATRWCVEHASSSPDSFKRKNNELGTEEIEIENVRHVLSLERNRNGQTNAWLADWNTIKRRFIHATPIKHIERRNNHVTDTSAAHFSNSVSAFGDRSNRSTKMGQVVDFGRAF